MTLFLLGSITAASVIFAAACLKCLVDAKQELKRRESATAETVQRLSKFNRQLARRRGQAELNPEHLKYQN